MTTSSSSTADRFLALCARVSPVVVQASSLHALSAILKALYAHSPRAYHSLTHVAACIESLDRHHHLAAQPDQVEFALFLHDCVYEPLAGDNEIRSADVAALMLRDLHAATPAIDTVRTLILATRHTGESLEGDAALIADIDTAILAAPAFEYDAYAHAIRAESMAVAEAEFRAGRAAFLRKLIGRRHIYHTEAFRDALDARARHNLTRELTSLDNPV